MYLPTRPDCVGLLAQLIDTKRPTKKWLIIYVLNEVSIEAHCDPRFTKYSPNNMYFSISKTIAVIEYS